VGPFPTDAWEIVAPWPCFLLGQPNNRAETMEALKSWRFNGAPCFGTPKKCHVLKGKLVIHHIEWGFHAFPRIFRESHFAGLPLQGGQRQENQGGRAANMVVRGAKCLLLM